MTRSDEVRAHARAFVAAQQRVRDAFAGLAQAKTLPSAHKALEDLLESIQRLDRELDRACSAFGVSRVDRVPPIIEHDDDGGVQNRAR